MSHLPVNANTFIATIGKGLARAERQAGCDWAERRFGQHFEIERITGTETPKMWKWPPGFAAYLMTRRGS